MDGDSDSFSSMEEGEVSAGKHSRRRARSRPKIDSKRSQKKALAVECSHCGRTTEEPGDWPNCAFNHESGGNWQKEMNQHFVCGKCIDGFCGTCHVFFCASCVSASGDTKLCKNCE